jgi:uncharacterized membrane protein YdfJ with MMPL/SSD domain
MTTGELQWLIGTAVTAIFAIAGIAIAAFRATANKIDDVAGKIKAGDDALHERINRVRDEYVKRIDLDGYMERMEETVKELRTETHEGTREINHRLDQVLTTLQPRGPPASVGR